MSPVVGERRHILLSLKVMSMLVGALMEFICIPVT